MGRRVLKFANAIVLYSDIVSSLYCPLGHLQSLIGSSCIVLRGICNRLSVVLLQFVGNFVSYICFFIAFSSSFGLKTAVLCNCGIPVYRAAVFNTSLGTWRMLMH